MLKMVEEIEKGKVPFRPRARIIKTIGEELISNDRVAIVELVKNSYDADAKKVTITFNLPFKKDYGSIEIKDDGSGMNLRTVKEGWMEPATIIKKTSENRRSRKGRKLLGEKGIGRFASAKLCKELVMTTKTKNDDEVYASFNWDDFNYYEKYLDEVECSLKVRKEGEIKKQGTSLLLNKLNSKWDEKKLKELKIFLSRLINPFETKIKNFEIELTLPKQFEALSGPISPPKILSQSNYRIKGSVNKDGKLNCVYESRNGDKKEIVKDLIIKKPEENAHKPFCGQFKFEFRVWNREPLDLKELSTQTGSTVKDIKRDLDAAAGISIYRDSFRVLPYGELKNDWLELDIRRVKNPAKNLSKNQIVGYVSINLGKKPGPC